MSYKIPRIQVKAGQTLFDVALQEYGTVEGIYLLLLANANQVSGITADLAPGQELLVWPVHVIEQIVSSEEIAQSYASMLMEWVARIGGTTGSGGTSGEFNDADYVHIRGNEVISGIKRFLDPVKADSIIPGGDDGVNVNGIIVDEGVIDLGRIDDE